MQASKGRGRGVLALQNCRTPLRRPKAFQIETSSVHCDFDTITSPEIKYTSCKSLQITDLLTLMIMSCFSWIGVILRFGFTA